MSRRDFIDSVIMQAENPDEFSEILSNHFDALANNAVVSLGINLNGKKVEDVVNALRVEGIDAVPYYSEKVENSDCFVVDESGIRTPYFSADDCLVCVKDMYNALHKNGIDIRGYALPLCEENLTRCVRPRADRQIDVIQGNSNIRAFITHQFEEFAKADKIDLKAKSNEKGVLYRGGTLGNQPYAITTSRCARSVCYATPDINIASKYADGGFSLDIGYLPIDGKKYGFIYEFKSDEAYKRYPEYGIEHRKELQSNQEMHETPIFPHRNPLKSVYLQYGKDIVQIADEKGYVSEDWKKFAELHGVLSANEKNDRMVKRANKLKDALDRGEDVSVSYVKKTGLANEDVNNSRLDGYVFGDNIKDGGREIKDANITAVSLPKDFENVRFSGNLILDNVDGLKSKKLDLSKCTGIIKLSNLDLRHCDELILPEKCDVLVLHNVQLPQNQKYLGVKECKNFVLFDQDLSGLEKLKFPKVENNIRFWGHNRMPELVDVSGVLNLTDLNEKKNLDFSKTQNLIIGGESMAVWRDEKIAILRKTMTCENAENMKVDSPKTKTESDVLKMKILNNQNSKSQ